MQNIKLKICGMKHPDNIMDVASLQPDYLGFIFYEKSARNFDNEIPSIPEKIKKVGVFVDASISFIMEKVTQYDLKVVQLHGNESPDFCNALHKDLEYDVALWKVFSIKDEFNFDTLKPYEAFVDCFLFDTKGKLKGGNGYTFDWTVLKRYNSPIPFILSGGIGLDELENLKEILTTDLPIQVIDVNSKFEIEPGLKNLADLKTFTQSLSIL
ncbi:phosphoribosylanthranilate isomerase [Aquimarina rhabdastrellae]